MNLYALYLLTINLIISTLQASVPDPLPEVCYAGGVMTNPCKGSNCAPCWLQEPDGRWACYDYTSSGGCQWGEDVGDRVKNRSNGNKNSSNGDNGENPTPISGNSNNDGNNVQPGPAGTRKYSSTKVVLVTKTVSNSEVAEMSYLCLILLLCTFI